MACAAASYLPRWDRATWSAPYLGLQAVPTELGPSKDTSAADWGTAAHEAKAGTGVDPWQEAFSPELREQYWPSRLGRHEVAFSYNCETGDVVEGPSNLPVQEMDAWKANQPQPCIVGTSDWVAELPSGEPWIDDLKTGWRKPEVRTYAMLFYGLCRQRQLKADTCRLSISHLPRAKVIDLANLRRYWLQVSSVALDMFADDAHIAWVKARPKKSLQTYPYKGMVKTGDHCGYCPSASICPSNKDIP